MTTRRQLLTGIAAIPLCAFASRAFSQAAKRIGVLSAGSRESTRYQFAAFEAGLRELGYIDNKNVTLDYRFADGKFERLDALAAQIIERQPTVILTQSTPAVVAAKKATATIPIVMVSIADPIGAGLVSNLARPGGNITGITNITAELAGKRLEILKEMMPRLSSAAVIINPDDPNARAQMSNAENAAQSLGVQLRPILPLRNAGDLQSVFAAAANARADGAIRMVDPLGALFRRRFVEQAASHRLPVIYPFREDAEAGGLISYGTNLPAQYTRAAAFVEKIFKGAKPADLPVEQPTNFELVINLKAANALKLTIPQSLLISADKVIE